MQSPTIVFTAPRCTAIENRDLETLGPNQVRVRTILSAISMGTESFILRGQLGESFPIDSVFSGSQKHVWPMVYGYQNVGCIEEVGARIDRSLIGTKVFGFKPHTAYYHAPLDELVRIPGEIPDHQAVLYASLETVVTLLWDAAPLLGERIAIYGLGTIGLLASCVIKGAGLFDVTGFETSPKRAARAENLGIQVNRDLEVPFDLQIELTGRQEILGQLMNRAAFESRIVIGSWYSDHGSPVTFGTDFHRKRITMISSQVSTLGGQYSSRLTKSRRQEEVLRLMKSTPTIPHFVHSFTKAESVYQDLINHPLDHQLMFHYKDLH